jgi:hypothetical protein
LIFRLEVLCGFMPGGCDRSTAVSEYRCIDALLNSVDSDKDMPGGHTAEIINSGEDF